MRRCLSPPQTIEGAIYSLSKDNLTANYDCSQGFKADVTTNEKTSTCSSEDPDKTPWTWSAPNYKCIQGMLSNLYFQVGNQ